MTENHKGKDKATAQLEKSLSNHGLDQIVEGQRSRKQVVNTMPSIFDKPPQQKLSKEKKSKKEPK